MKASTRVPLRVLSAMAFVVACTVCQVQTSSAGELADKKTWADAEKTFTEAKAYVKKICGGDVELKVNKKSFSDPEALKIVSWCGEYVNAIASLCGLSEMKDHAADIMKGVKTVTCSYDAAIKSDGSATNYGNKFTKSGAAFTASFNKNSANMSDSFRDYLKKEL